MMNVRRQCIQCNIWKDRTWDGSYVHQGRWKHRVFRDDKNRKWHGRYCGECHAQRGHMYQKMYGRKTKEEMVVFHNDPLTDRVCRICEKPLPSSKYFYHDGCKPSVDLPYGEDEYGGFCNYGAGY